MHDSKGEQIFSDGSDAPMGSWEESMVVRKKDAFKKLLGDGNSRVSMALSERMSGPYGYSSVNVNVSITVTCNQDEDTIEEAAHLAFEEAVAISDDVFPKAMMLLEEHLKKYVDDD
jgi:hypothetical protein